MLEHKGRGEEFRYLVWRIGGGVAKGRAGNSNLTSSRVGKLGYIHIYTCMHAYSRRETLDRIRMHACMRMNRIQALQQQMHTFVGYRCSFVIPTVRREGQRGIFIYVRGEIWSRMDERDGLRTLGGTDFLTYISLLHWYTYVRACMLRR